MSNLLEGRLVRLMPLDPKEYARISFGWNRDAEFTRLSGTDPASMWSEKKIEKHVEEELTKEGSGSLAFGIHTLVDNRLVGSLDISNPPSPHREAWVGIGIGDRADWSKGYGTDAMRVLLRFGFMELNLRRIALNTFEYNPRGMRCYEKAGFHYEGVIREYLHREGRRWDFIFMGILREEWEALPEK